MRMVVRIAIAGMLAQLTGALLRAETPQEVLADAGSLLARVESEITCRIDDATDGSNSGSLRLAWVSQPGAITVIGNPNVVERYRLYSAPDVLAHPLEILGDDVDPNWDQMPDHFVDLNAAVPVFGKNVYPIVPADLHPTHSTDTPEGFDYGDTINGATINGVVPGESAPMPVSWLYVLRDGSLGILDSNLIYRGEGTASPENPIVGRVAFWTDDLSCKVNVNTASEGVFWDPPRADSPEERRFARKVPGYREWQRHHGHPAMVSMSSVFMPGKRYYAPDDNGDLPDLTIEDAQSLWRAAPGVAANEGTVGSTRESPAESSADPAPPLIEKLADYPLATTRAIEDYGFFVTPKSSSPEENFAGLPRISMWPLPAAEQAPEGVDLLMTRAAQIGGTSYAFRRSDPTALHFDYFQLDGAHNEKRLRDYLVDIVGSPRVPGFVRRISDGHGGSHPDSDLYEWLSLAQDQIAATNIGYAGGLAAGLGCHVPWCQCGGDSQHLSRWDRIVGFPAKGIGRIPTVTEIALVLFCTAEHRADGTGAGNDWQELPLGTRRVRVSFVVEANCPRHGVNSVVPDVTVTLGGSAVLGRFREGSNAPRIIVGGEAMATQPDGAGLRLSSPRTPAELGRQSWAGGEMGVRLLSSLNSESTDSTMLTQNGEPFVLVPIGQNTVTVSFPEAMRVIVFAGTEADASRAVQSLSVQFPSSVTLPQPEFEAPQTWQERLELVRSHQAGMIRSGDSVHSMVVSHGDARLLASSRVISSGVFRPHPRFGQQRHAHSLTFGDGGRAIGYSVGRELVPGARYSDSSLPDLPISPDHQNFASLAVSSNIPRGSSLDPNVTGEFNTNLAGAVDGSIVDAAEMPPAGNAEDAYFNPIDRITQPGSTAVAPQLITAGPGALGSLPIRVASGLPWQSALFRPYPKRVSDSSPPDHWLADLFRMPVVEPLWSSSTETAGKINLNQAIVPFGHIRRTTALHALLKAEKVMAIPSGEGVAYKSPQNNINFRHYIDSEKTIEKLFEQFESNELCHSATQISEFFLVPEGFEGEPTDQALIDFWDDHRLTGDNVRERPYTALQNRLCVRSNWFQTHYWVQAIDKDSEVSSDTFDPAKDLISSSQRGSVKIRRSIPEGTSLPDYTVRPSIQRSLSSFYEASVVERDIFAPSAAGVAIQSIRALDDGALFLRWRSTPGKRYIVQRSVDGSDWNDATDLLVATSLSMSWLDDEPLAAERVLYRIAELP